MKLAALVIATMGLLASTGATYAGSLDAGAHYVALGSSFAAGSGIGTVKPDTPGRCGRSTQNYATILAKELSLVLDDQTCNGARTSDILNPWNELPAQIDAVRSDTKLVTATIGGNDLNYAAYLLATGCGPDGKVAIGGMTIACPPHAVPSDEAYARVEANMREMIRRVRERAPNARFVFVQYVTLVPSRPCDAARLTADEARIAREIGRRLAQITSRAAQLEGGEVVAADRLSRHRTACDARPWSVGAKEMPGQGVLWHPTKLAHSEIAEILAERLKR